VKREFGFSRAAFVLAIATVLVAVMSGNANEPPSVKGTPPAIRAAEPVATPLAQSSVYITVDLGGGSSAHGTGTVIASEGAKSLILTNAHVVPSGDRPISVTYWCDRRPWVSPATYLGGSAVVDIGPHLIDVRGPDLALLLLDCAALPAVEIAGTLPATGDPVSLYGFGGASSVAPLHKAGRVLSDDRSYTTAGDPIARTSISTVNGDSGAGILNEAGQLVAVHWGHGAVRLDTVHAFVVRSLRDRAGLFSRLRDRLAARKIAKAIAAAISDPTPPPAKNTAPHVPAPAAPALSGGCENGQCPSTRRRGILRR
jgi:S1-C subfamily serine protease